MVLLMTQKLTPTKSTLTVLRLEPLLLKVSKRALESLLKVATSMISNLPDLRLCLSTSMWSLADSLKLISRKLNLRLSTMCLTTIQSQLTKSQSNSKILTLKTDCKRDSSSIFLVMLTQILYIFGFAEN